MLSVIVLEQVSEKYWRASFREDPRVYGVGRRESEAVAALLQDKLGELILQNPGILGLSIERHE